MGGPFDQIPGIVGGYVPKPHHRGAFGSRLDHLHQNPETLPHLFHVLCGHAIAGARHRTHPDQLGHNLANRNAKCLSIFGDRSSIGDFHHHIQDLIRLRRLFRFLLGSLDLHFGLDRGWLRLRSCFRLGLWRQLYLSNQRKAN